MHRSRPQVPSARAFTMMGLAAALAAPVTPLLRRVGSNAGQDAGQGG